MQTEMNINSNAEGQGVITLTVPAKNTVKIAEVIRSVLALAGHKVKRVNDDGEEWVSADEVFPGGSPAMALRGLRGREDITQAELAARLGVSQNVISEMESGQSPQRWPSGLERSSICHTRCFCSHYLPFPIFCPS